MATSQNGFRVLTSAPSKTLKWITGRVAPGNVATVLEYVCKRYDAEVEQIKVGWSWGWAYRPVRGSSSGYSNHASGTAVDLNAPAHPLGVRGTFSGKQVEAGHKIVRDLGGVIRWGEDYQNRKDGMHWEINANAAAVAAAAAKIRNGQLPGAAKLWAPAPKAVHIGRVQEQFLIAAGADKGQVVKNNGVGRIQEALNKVVGSKLAVDGYVGKATLNAWGTWEKRVGVIGRPRVPDRRSLDALSEKAGFDVVGKTENEKKAAAKKGKK